MKLPIKKALIPNDWMTPTQTNLGKQLFTDIALQVGYANGYVGVPPGHPWHGLDYNAQELDHIGVHGGLTYADNCLPRQEPDGYWYFGFDTAHCGDTPQKWTKEACQAELDYLENQMIACEPAYEI